MQTNQNILQEYINVAPLALAFERTVESKIYEKLPPFQRPILDLGCGEGLFAKIVFKEPIDTGIDPNPRELEAAKEFGGYKELIQCWGNKIPKPDGSYNTIISNSVLEHIPDLKPVLNEAHRLLATGGVFYFTVPSHMFDKYTWISQVLIRLGLRKVADRYAIFFNNFWRHYHFYPIERWVELGREAGFEVIESFTYNPQKLCMINSFLSPFALPQMIMKKMTNRWIIFPSIRKLIAGPLAYIGGLLLKNGERAENGGLVFVALQKGRKK